LIIAVHQPQYLPWLGYFDKILRADIFVLLDNVQFKKNEFQNRNKIKTANGWQWLTVPVKYRFPQLINEVEINNTVRWQHKQHRAIITNYSKAPFKGYLDEFFEELFSRKWDMLSDLNIFIVKRLCKILGIDTQILVASRLGDLPQDRDERLISIVEALGGDTYLAGAGGREYMDIDKYRKRGIRVIFQDYIHPVYHQLFGEFQPYMSIIDLILNCGDKSLEILRSQQ